MPRKYTNKYHPPRYIYQMVADEGLHEILQNLCKETQLTESLLLQRLVKHALLDRQMPQDSKASWFEALEEAIHADAC